MEVDWNALFNLSQPVAETVIRGSAVYWFLFLLFRFVIRRDVGSVGLSDVLVLVIIADAAQNGMAGEYTSITDGFILISVIVFWNFVLDWLSFRFPRLARLAEASPLILVSDGRMVRNNLKREFLSEDDLMTKMREQGVEDLSKIKNAYMESDGTISVIKRESFAHAGVASPNNSKRRI
ncbi:MAG: DUF421 domain-containing protein [Gammaproteobacteria bacterium]